MSDNLEYITEEYVLKKIKENEYSFNDFLKYVNNIIYIFQNITNKYIIDITINKINNKIIKLFFNTCKYFMKSYYLENNESKVISIIDNNLRIIENSIKDKMYNNFSYILLYYNFLYNISYYNINKKKYYERISKIYRKLYPNLNYISKRCQHQTIVKRKKIKIGFVSTRLNKFCSVFRDRSEIIKKLDNTKFEKYLIIDNKISKNSEIIDIEKKWIKTLYENVNFIVEWKELKSINEFINKCKRIGDLELDIIVYCDIGMSAESVIMSHLRLAPIQINTWGHSVTSGISTIDYYISSKYYEKDIKISQEHYSEKLILCNSLCTYYNRMDYSNMKTKEELGLPIDKIILFCMQNPYKINIEFLDICKCIVQKNNNIIILLQKAWLSEKQIIKIKKKYSFIIFIEECVLHTYNNYIYYSDLILDPYPFGGCNSSLEAFNMGKIIITRPAEYLSGRFTYGFYKKMGIMDTVVDSYDEYVEKVIYYLNNKKEKKELEERILSKKNILYFDKDSVNEWEEILIELSKSYVELEDSNKNSLSSIIKLESISVVITSCNRPKLLEKTIISFMKYNTYPIYKLIIIEDSGYKGINDFVIELIPNNIKLVLLYNDTNIGQLKSIDKAYALVDTEYIFHCEEDWEFYKSGFIEESLKIIKIDNKIINVWIRNHNDTNGHPIIKTIKKNLYYYLINNYRFPNQKHYWMGFTFNPSLRRKSDYDLIKTYVSACKTPYLYNNKLPQERDLQIVYKELGYRGAITKDSEGYVKHIGWGKTINKKNIKNFI